MWRIPPPNSSPLPKCPPFFLSIKLVTFSPLVNGLSLQSRFYCVRQTKSSAVAETTQGHSKRHCWVGHVYVPISIPLKLCLYIVPFLRYSSSKMAWPWNRSRGRSRSLKWRRSIDHIYDFLLVRYCKYSSILYRFSVIWRWIISWPWNVG